MNKSQKKNIVVALLVIAVAFALEIKTNALSKLGEIITTPLRDMTSIMVDNDRTTIICNYGNKRTFTASETNIKFNRIDFWFSYPDKKRDAVRKACGITTEGVREALEEFAKHFDSSYNEADLPPQKGLFEVKPVFKWF